MPVWLDKVPIAVTGILYNTEFLQDFLFRGRFNFANKIFENVCENEVFKNVSCYLINEYGIIVMANKKVENSRLIGKPFYLENPWIMFDLEIDGFFELVISGKVVNYYLQFDIIQAYFDYNLKDRK